MIKLNFETLTPLHISNGEQLAYNLEYIITDNGLAKLDMYKASQVLAKEKLFNFSSNYRFNDIIKIIEKNKHLFSNDCFVYEVYTGEAFEEYLKNERRDGQKIVQEFINSNGNFYIPGSSVKGMLSTILDRDYKKNPLGINPENPDISHKFVIIDSPYLDPEDITVDVVNRPPSINVMTLDPSVEFILQVRAKGNLDLSELRKKLQTYSFGQMKKAKSFAEQYKQLEKKPGGAANYHSILERMLSSLVLEENEYLVNLGFGGGSYYKIFANGTIPTFPNPGRKKKKEEAHTTFSLEIDNELHQLGWCRLKIEEE